MKRTVIHQRERRGFRCVLSLWFALVLTGIASSASAQGTHFIAEGGFGIAMPLGIETDQIGLAASGTLGFGGKVPGSLLRMYALAEFDISQFSIQRGEVALQRDVSNLAAGGRLLLPLTGNIRVFGDVLLGMAWLESEERSESGRPVWVTDADPRMTVAAGFGVQFRPLTFLSVGAKTSFLFLLDDSYLPDEEISGCMNILGTATLHF